MPKHMTFEDLPKEMQEVCQHILGFEPTNEQVFQLSDIMFALHTFRESGAMVGTCMVCQDTMGLVRDNGSPVCKSCYEEWKQCGSQGCGGRVHGEENWCFMHMAEHDEEVSVSPLKGPACTLTMSEYFNWKRHFSEMTGYEAMMTMKTSEGKELMNERTAAEKES